MGILTSLVLPVVGHVAGAYFTNKANKSAAKQTNNATNSAIAEQRRQFDEIQRISAPARDAQTRAFKSMEDLLSGKTDITKTPGYEFRLAEGQKGIERAASAGGRLASGRTLKEMGRYSSDYAASEFDNEFRRQAQLAGLGAEGTRGTINGLNSTSNSVSELYGDFGRTNAGVIQSQNRVNTDAASNVTKAFQTAKLLGVI